MSVLLLLLLLCWSAVRRDFARMLTQMTRYLGWTMQRQSRTKWELHLRCKVPG